MLQRKCNKTIYFTLTIIIFLYEVTFCVQINARKYNAINIDKSKISVHDGDTFSFDDKVIRVVGIDTPELKSPRWNENQYLGEEAREFVIKLIKKANEVAYIPIENDIYNRTLSHILINNELLSEKLIEVGLAYETISRYGDNGFTDLAEIIVKASEKYCTPNFEKPWKWRAKKRHIIM